MCLRAHLCARSPRAKSMLNNGMEELGGGNKEKEEVKKNGPKVRKVGLRKEKKERAR